MRTSRGSLLAVGLLLGLSGCAGVGRPGPSVPSGGPVVGTPAPGGVRGWWARKFGGRGAYQPTIRTAPGMMPGGTAWPDQSAGWQGIFQFSRPPWVTRQPERAPIFSRNDAVPSQPQMSPAEVNEAIARMAKPRTADDRILPVRNVDEPEGGGEESSAVLARGLRLPDAPLPDPRLPSPGEPAAESAPEPEPQVVDDRPSLLGEEVADEAGRGPDPFERVALADAATETRPEPADEEVVRSAQVPPPPPLRPAPGTSTPTPTPPAEKPVEAPALDPPAEEAPPAKPAETPAKPVETPPPAEAPKPEAPKPEATKPAEVVPTSAPEAQAPAKPAEPAATAPAAPATPTNPSPAVPVVDQPRVEAQPQGAVPPPEVPAVMTAAPARPHRWSFWNWQPTGKHAARVEPQDQPAQLPPVMFPTSYDSVWARPLVPCPQSAHVPLASPQAPPVVPSPQGFATTYEKAPCWLVERLKGRMSQMKAWKEEHICKHIKSFKSALKGEGCKACSHHVTASPQVAPTPQAKPTPQAQPTPQGGLPVIGGSRFGLY